MTVIETILVALATAAIGWAVGFKKTNADVRKTEVEATDIAVKIWRDLASEFQKEVHELRSIVNDLRKENIYLKEQVEILDLKLKKK